jgi:hypothetical protein
VPLTTKIKSQRPQPPGSIAISIPARDHGAGQVLANSRCDHQGLVSCADRVRRVTTASMTPKTQAQDHHLAMILINWELVPVIRGTDSRMLSMREARGRFILDHDLPAAAQSDVPQLTATNQPPHELSR